MAASLAALVPKPRAHLTCYHGIFAPNSAVRALLIAGRKAGRGSGKEQAEQTDAKRHRAMIWVQRLKRVFHIEIEICRRCSGKLRVIASIEEPQVIERILNHLRPRQRVARSNPSEPDAAAARVADLTATASQIPPGTGT